MFNKSQKIMAIVLLVILILSYLIFRVDVEKQLTRTPAQDNYCIKVIGHVPIFPYCRAKIINDSRGIALIVGDSHAHTAFPGLAKLFSRKKYSTFLFANSGCPPYIGASYATSDRTREECVNQTNSILENSNKLKGVKIILIISRGIVYYTGVNLRDNLSEQKKKVPYYSREIFISGVNKTISELKKISKNIYFVEENPQLLKHPKNCQFRIFMSSKNECVDSRANQEIWQHEYLNLITKEIDSKVLRTFNLFCPNNTETCKIYDGFHLLYADEDHISIRGSELQAKYLIKQISSL